MRPTFEDVYKKYFKFVRRLVRRRVPSCDVEDLMQLVFAGIARGLPNYDPTLPIEPWIGTIAFRAIRAYYSREITRTTAEEGLAEIPRDAEPSDEEQVGRREIIPAALACLTPRQRELVVRVIWDEEAPEVIAEKMGITTDGVYKLLQAALKKLSDFGKRQLAIERRLLGKPRAFLVPLGLDLHLEAWIARMRSALWRALMKLKGMSANLGAGAGLTVTLGAGVVPPIHSSTPVEEVAPKIAAQVAVAAVAPAALVAPAMPAPSASNVTGRSSAGSMDDRAAAEQRSLDHIQALLEAAPDEAVAALELHKKTYPHEEHRADRVAIEETVRAETATRRTSTTTSR